MAVASDIGINKIAVNNIETPAHPQEDLIKWILRLSLLIGLLWIRIKTEINIKAKKNLAWATCKGWSALVEFISPRIFEQIVPAAKNMHDVIMYNIDNLEFTSIYQFNLCYQ